MLRFFDMFSGIGGFRAGLSLTGDFHCVGYCEIDKYAARSYQAIFNTEGEYFCDDARKINPEELPDFELLCAGFPCQPFSQAGKRRGFDDTRGTLFFEIARLVRAKRPKYLLLENVPGLLTHDKGRTFNTILSTLSDLRYHVEWQLLNSKNFGVAQSRRRLYAFCYLDERCAGKVLPIRETNESALKQLIGGRQGQRVYDSSGLSCTLTSGGGGKAGKCGLYFIDLNEKPQMTDVSRCITSKYNSGVSNRVGEHSGVFIDGEKNPAIADLAMLSDKPIPMITPERVNKRQNGKRYRAPDAPMFTLTAQDRHGILLNGRIRKLLPAECLRLQGFDDDQIEKIIAVNSDNQVYRQAGNGVTVTVVYEIGRRIWEVENAIANGEILV